MTYEQNVRAILESNFAGFKEEIIDLACKRICMLGTKEETLDRVLEIMEINIRFEKSFKDEAHTLAANVLVDVRKQIEALKDGDADG